MDPAVLVFAGGLGAIVGSFLNVVIHRLPAGESIVHPRSRCPGCREPIPAWANVPILSWLALRGRCHRCKAPISIRYPLVELLTAVVFVVLARYGSAPPRLFAEWVLCAALIAVTFIDLDHHIIPNVITKPGVVIALAVAWLAPPDHSMLQVPFYVDALLGAVLCGGMLYGISVVYERRFGRIGLGLGDAKLVMMLGAFLGLFPTLHLIILGCVLGIAQFGILALFGRMRSRTPIAFGPALAVAGVLHVLQPELLAPLLMPTLR